MANPEHLEILKQGVGFWNKWRTENPGVTPDLSEANLMLADLRGSNLWMANLANTDLQDAKLADANLILACLHHANLNARTYLAQIYLGRIVGKLCWDKQISTMQNLEKRP